MGRCRSSFYAETGSFSCTIAAFNACMACGFFFFKAVSSIIAASCGFTFEPAWAANVMISAAVSSMLSLAHMPSKLQFMVAVGTECCVISL